MPAGDCGRQPGFGRSQRRGGPHAVRAVGGDEETRGAGTSYSEGHRRREPRPGKTAVMSAGKLWMVPCSLLKSGAQVVV